MRFSEWMEARHGTKFGGFKTVRWDIRPKSDPGLVSKRMRGKIRGKTAGGKGQPAPDKTPPRDPASAYDIPKEKPADMDDEQWEKFQNQLKRYRDS